MPAPLGTRLRAPATIAALALAATALATIANASQPSRVPDGGDAGLLGAQKQAALRIIHASIWEGANEALAEARRAAARPRPARAPHAAPATRHARPARAPHAAPATRHARPGSHPRAAAAEPAPRPAPRAGAATALETTGVPLNVMANDPSHDGTGATQSECGAAGIGRQFVVAWNNGQGLFTGFDLAGLAYSNDGGATYTAIGAPAHVAGAAAFRWIGDPVVAADSVRGVFYVAGLARTDATHNAIAVARGRFRNGVFATDSAFIVRQVSNATMFLDKEWLACDPASGNVYVTNTTFGSADTIDFMRSTNGGRTWSAPLKLSSPYDAGWVQGSRVAVAPNGDVEVAWYAADQVTVESDLRFRRSTNQGVSFGTEVTPVKFNEQFGTGGPGFNRDWGPNFPSLAVDRGDGPHAGRIYLSWAECWRFLATAVPVGAAVFEQEPNGNAAAATPFAVGQTLRGTLTTSPYGVFDQDWFAFPLATGQSVIVFADSVAVPSGWILRLVAPDGTQRLCRGGASDSTQNTDAAAPGQAYFTFTAPAAGTYFLQMYAQSYAPVTYAIRTAFGAPGGERGRDQRDVFVTWSDDGVAWAAPVRLDDDAPGYDAVYPELAAGADGMVYASWYDHRDDTYGSRTNLELTRTTDGGATWAANHAVTSAQGNFTTSASNLTPNLGDYQALAGTGGALLAAWGDGRATSSVDAWAAALDLSSDLDGCPADTAIAAGATLHLAGTVTDREPVFGGTWTATLADVRAWPLPGPVAIAVPAGSSAGWSADVAVPDTAAAGADSLTLTLTGPGGATVRRCRFALSVTGVRLGVAPAAGALRLAPGRPNPAAGGTWIDFDLPVAGRARLAIYDLAGARVRLLLDTDLPAGPGSVRWDGRDDRGVPVAPGSYFDRLEAGGRALARRIILTR